MKALIIADEVGEGLKPFTEYSPKGLLEIGGTTLLERMLGCLSQIGIKEVFVVTGYLGEKIETKFSESYRGMSLTYIRNTQYQRKGSAALWAAREILKGDDFLILKADIFFPVQMLTKFLNEKIKNGYLKSNRDKKEEIVIGKISKDHLDLFRSALESPRQNSYDSFGFILEWLKQRPHRCLRMGHLPWIRISCLDDLKTTWRRVLPAIERCEAPSSFLRWDERLHRFLARFFSPSILTLLGLTCGIISLFLFSSGKYERCILGALFYVFSEIFNPGRSLRTPIRILLFLAMGFGLWKTSGCIGDMVLGALAGLGTLIFYFLLLFIQRFENKKQEAFYVEFRREDRVRWYKQFKINLPWIVFLFALFNALPEFLWMASIGVQVLWISVLLLRMKEIVK